MRRWHVLAVLLCLICTVPTLAKLSVGERVLILGSPSWTQR